MALAESLIRQRITEVQKEAAEPADCPLRERARPQGGCTVVYHGDFLPEEN